ncbi:hypothetical protein G4B88_007132, partial [Cannabis sativa]
GASRRRSRREFHGTPGRRDLGNVVILGIVKTGLEKTLSFIVHVSSIWCCCCYFDFDVIEVVLVFLFLGVLYFFFSGFEYIEGD